MLSLNEALEQMLRQLPSPLATEVLPLNQAAERICGEDIFSPINVPAFDNSAMDGYAVRLADLTSEEPLEIIGKAFAGVPFQGNWQHRSVVRIMTGAMIPKGTEAIIMQENAKVHTDGRVSFNKLPKLGENIRRAGEDIKKGMLVLPAGSKLTSVTLPLLASLGLAQIKVFPKLKVAVIATGDELVSVGQPLAEGQIYDINSFSLTLMLKKLGCEVIDFGIIPDDEVLFEQSFKQAQAQADLIITSGGVSVGEADFTKTILERLGTINFWKIALKPGKPFAFGKLGKTWFCGLPGNPVSALVTFYQLVQPAIAKLTGWHTWQLPPSLPAITRVALKKRAGRLEFQRGFYQVNENGEIIVENVGVQNSNLFSAFMKSNCFIVLEEERGNVEIGEHITIQPFNEIL